MTVFEDFLPDAECLQNVSSVTGDLNPLRRIWDEGGDAIGAKTMTASPSVVEVYGALDMDFAWIDFERTDT